MQVKYNSQTGQYKILEGGKAVLQYNYANVNVPEGYKLEGKNEKAIDNKKKYVVARSDYIHPLYGLDGEELTLDWSGDHPHHRGIYWAGPSASITSARPISAEIGA